MKALCIKEPWIHLIFGGHKTVEYRTWRTDYRGGLVVCSSKTNYAFPKECMVLDYGEKWADDNPFYTIPGGYAVGIVELLDVVPFKAGHVGMACLDTDPGRGFAWIIKPKLEFLPIPIKGRLGLFDLNIAPEPLPAGFGGYDDYLLKQKGLIITA